MMTEKTASAPVPAKLLNALVGVLSALILGFLALSSVDLFNWARSPKGLGLPPELAWIFPFAFDFGALVCIILTLIATVQGMRPGVAAKLVWVLAGVSAYSQMRHGFAERDAGRAQELWWAMPAVALLGPLLLEIVIRYFRRFRRVTGGEQMAASAGFGIRWLPGIAFRETLAAWRASRQEGISDAAGAVEYVRQRDALRQLTQPGDALRYALAELVTQDVHAARKWLARHRVTVTQADVDAADAQVRALTQAGDAPDAPPVTQKVTRAKVRHDAVQAASVTHLTQTGDAPDAGAVTQEPAENDTSVTRDVTHSDDAVTQALALVDAGASVRHAARQAGASEATVRRRNASRLRHLHAVNE